jgi:phage tail-like protein
MSFGLNAAFSLFTNFAGFRLDPYQGCNFLVEIENTFAGAFSECTGLVVETEVQQYREGGVNEFIHSFVTGTKYTNLTLKHGLTLIDGLWLWHQDVVQGKIQRRNGTIYLLDKNKGPVLWWDFKGAYPVKWTGPDLKADNANVAFETVELTHRGLSRPKFAAQIAGAAGLLAGQLDLSLGFNT